MTVNGASASNLYDIVNQQYTDTVVKAVERVSTGLKINSTADDNAAAVISASLGANSSSLLSGIENANDGLGLVTVSNRALSQQEDILNLIKDRLTYAQSADDSTRDTVRTEIQSLLEDFDEIAASTSYNDNYSLQQSATDTSESLSISLTFSNETSVTTEPIQSNSEGVNLTNLKNLASGELTYDNIVTELANVDTAISTVDSYQDNFELTQNEIQLSIDNLTNVQEGNAASQEYLTQANIGTEQAIVDQYNRLVNSSEYAIVQANTTQERVLQLLTNIPEYEPTEEKDTYATTSKDDDTTTNSYEQKESSNYSYEASSPSFSSSSTPSASYSASSEDS